MRTKWDRKCHYEPFSDEFYDSSNMRFMCGSLIPVEYADFSNNWDSVTCEKCRKNKKEIMNSVDRIVEHSVKDMYGFTKIIREKK